MNSLVKCVMITISTNQPEENPMTSNEELQLLAVAKTGDDKAREAVIKKYDRLCHKLAHKFAFTHLLSNTCSPTLTNQQMWWGTT